MRVATTTFLAVSVPLSALAVPNPLFAPLRSLLRQATAYTGFDVSLASDTAMHVVEEQREYGRQWVQDGKAIIEQAGVTYEQVKFNPLSEYSLRFRSPKLCDPDVKQYSGYLDITSGKHLFFWFFEARKNPETAPLLLWLNGGPGCSSSTGLLFELGPCSIAKNETYSSPFTKPNPYSWTEYANVIFLDQPVNVGFSYSSDGSTVSNTPAAAQDVWAFLELFLSRFPEYANADFHIAAESYGGHYAPNIASVVHKKNKELIKSGNIEGFKEINLKSIILANGITEPYTQFGTIPEYLCNGPYPVLDNDGPKCAALRSKVPTCQRLVKSCYNSNSRFACVPAGIYCSTQLWGELQELELNPYDVRKKCKKEEDGQLCYKQMEWIDEWMNLPEVQAELGVQNDRTFQSCNMQVNQAFFFQGDGMHNSASLLPELLQDGKRLLVYAGNADGMCNYMGNHDWMEVLDEHPYVAEFRNATGKPWTTPRSRKYAGRVKSVGGKGAGSYTYIEVDSAGHMVPYDQPEAALDLFDRWVNNKSFAT